MNEKMIPKPERDLKIFPTKEVLYKTAAEFIVATAKKCVSSNGRFTISLSGGRTPQAIYALLSEIPFRDQMPWEKTFFFWGDERCVPLTDEKNNSHQARLALFDKITIPSSNVFPIPVDELPVAAASDYEKEIKLFFESDAPQFDLILLGLGENGHTASLFPDTGVVNEKSVGVREVYSKEEKIFRVTMTAPLINLAHEIMFLVTGANKASVLKKVLTASFQPDKLPAQLIKPVNGALHWFIDRPAANLIAQIQLQSP